VWLSILWDQGTPPLQWGIVIGASLVAAISDIRARKIPNVLTVPVFLGGLGWATYAGGQAGLMDSIVGCLSAALPFVVLFVFAGGGAGDAKLMGALGAWLGTINGLFALGAVLLAGGVMAIVFALAKKRMLKVLSYIGMFAYGIYILVLQRGNLRDVRRVSPETEAGRLRMPYAVAIFAGVCVACLGVSLWRASA